jgi:uncharacterized protein with HEPN domain
MRDRAVYLSDVLEFIDRIEKNSEEKEKFLTSKNMQDVVLFNLEKIGEALKQFALKFPDVSNGQKIKEFIGLRDVIIHKYFDLDYKLIWKIVKEDLPLLKKEMSDKLKPDKQK